ncbi:MAG: LysR family transcriptional regulator [Mycobacterium sp.]|nr:LysR family transcriptional regulator [Mycobacterium sp.]
MNLQQLRYAVALAEAKSFTRAADQMSVVQSALSQQIRRLEEHLAIPLFDRTTRSVALTPAGEALMPLLRQVVAGVEQIEIDAQALSGTVAGRIRVGMMEIPSESLDLATLMATFHTRYPKVSVTLRSGGSDALIAAVRDRKLEAAIVGATGAAVGAHLTFTDLFAESLVAVIPSDHPLAAAASVSTAELARLPFIDFPTGYGLRHETDRGFAGITRRVAFEVTRVDEVIQFVRKNLGVALLPESVARTRAATDPGLALREVTGADMHRQVHLVTQPPHLRSAACQAFIDGIVEHVAPSD